MTLIKTKISLNNNIKFSNILCNYYDISAGKIIIFRK